MTNAFALAFYTGAILAGALAGGALPLLGQFRRSDLLLSFSAGVMLGAAFFHMLPEAVEGAGATAIPFVLVGFLLLYSLERFVLVHVCAEPSAHAAPGLPGSHAHGLGPGCGAHTMGLAAFLGMSLHTIVDGFALGAASEETGLGLLVFLAILAHKIPNAFSLSAILRAEGYSVRRALTLNAAFALMVPVGAGLYLMARELVRVEDFTSAALAASAGTFLHLSLSDIVPDLHRRGVARFAMTAAMVAGLAVMGALTLLRHGHAH
jgi:zinc and cadmium transporter